MVEAQGRRILLIHDDATKLAVLQQALQHAQFQVNAAPSSPAAIRDLRQLRPDIVVCRNRMPMLGGRHVIRAVATVDSDIPVILTTEDPDPRAVVDLLRAGAFDCVQAPVESVELLIDAAQRAAELAERRRRVRALEAEVDKAHTRMARLLEQEAVIRERAFAKVEEPLERAIRNLSALGKAPDLTEAHQLAVRAVLGDVWEVSDRLQSAQTDASRTSTRSVTLEDFHPLAIGEFFRDALLKLAHAEQVELAYIVPPELPALRGDPEQLQSVLVDLGRYLIGVGGTRVVYLELKVVERGPGPWLVRFDVGTSDAVEPVAGPNVIERYLPGDDVATVREELIDLSRSARAVSLLGGELEMYQAQAGTRFGFELGLIEAKRRTSDLVDPGLEPADVLVAASSAVVRRGLSMELSKLGMRVTAAGTGAQATHVLRRATEAERMPALVLVSVELPTLEVLHAYLERAEPSDRPRMVYMARAGEVVAEDPDARVVMRPPRRSILIELLKPDQSVA